jgi:chemotaxis protein methyltransferase CheR
MASPALVSPSPRERSEFVLTDHDFRQIAAFVQAQTGIQLPPHKKNLVYSRLARRLRELKLDTFRAYLEFLNRPEGVAETARMINALTTNHTKFFREEHHFQHLAASALPEILARKTRKLRIWSAGCSLGAEPYTIAMVLQETLPDAASWDIKILATDLDTDVLDKASAGIYGSDAQKDIPAKYFRGAVSLTLDASGQVVMPEQFKRWMHFKQLNFLHPWPMKQKFDLIFCRNVLIYFDRPTQDDLFQRFSQYLTPNGYLYIGHSETIRGMEAIYRPCGKTIYQKV